MPNSLSWILRLRRITVWLRLGLPLHRRPFAHHASFDYLLLQLGGEARRRSAWSALPFLPAKRQLPLQTYPCAPQKSPPLPLPLPGRRRWCLAVFGRRVTIFVHLTQDAAFYQLPSAMLLRSGHSRIRTTPSCRAKSLCRRIDRTMIIIALFFFGGSFFGSRRRGKVVVYPVGECRQSRILQGARCRPLVF